MNNHDTVRVELGERSYDIHIGTGILQQAGPIMAPLLRHQPCIIVTDSSVAPHHLGTLTASLDSEGIDHRTLEMEAGEQTKDLAGLERLTGAILDRLTHRVHILEANGESYRLRESRSRRQRRTAPHS